MRTLTNYGAVSVGGIPPIYRSLLALSILAAILVMPVSAYNDSFTPILAWNTSIVHINQTFVNDSSPGTPWQMWAASAIAAVLLFLYSLNARATSMELEKDAILSVLAWIPSAFFAYSSFAVDKLEGAGMVAIAKASGVVEYTYIANHTIYHFPALGVVGIAFLALCILNTYRIITLHKVLQGKENTQQ